MTTWEAMNPAPPVTRMRRSQLGSAARSDARVKEGRGRAGGWDGPSRVHNLEGKGGGWVWGGGAAAQAVTGEPRRGHDVEAEA